MQIGRAHRVRGMLAICVAVFILHTYGAVRGWRMCECCNADGKGLTISVSHSRTVLCILEWVPECRAKRLEGKTDLFRLNLNDY